MHADKIYKELVEDILANGEEREDRTGVGTLSVFGRQCRYDLNEGFPILTTKKVHFKSVVGELLWFLRGDTNVKWLNDHGITIWDAWATVEQTAKFNRGAGELGPVYGALWRNWEAIDKTIKTSACEYDITSTYTGIEDGLYHGWQWGDNTTPWHPVRKIDQIKEVVDRIKNDPTSRRLIVSGWNPGTCDIVALPPCHTLFQFYVSKSKLSCQLYQRSCDAFLGMPFNIASYALLTHMIAQVCGLGVGEFIHTFGDLHVYKNHTEQLELQLRREPFPSPKLVLGAGIRDVDSFTFDDIKLDNYQHHPAIKGKVAV